MTKKNTTEENCNLTDDLLVSLNDVTLSQSGQTIFKHIDWQILHRQHWAIIDDESSNGTIITKAIAMNMPIQEGKIFYFLDTEYNRRIYFESGKVVRVGPDSYYALKKRYTGYQQARWQSFEGGQCPTVKEILTGQSIENRSKFHVNPQRVDEETYKLRRDKAIKMLEVEELMDRKIIYLSTGENRKVLIARALMQAPRLLILEDPCGGLDKHSRTKLLKHIDKMIADEYGPTIIIVTPRSEEIPDEIEYFAVLENHNTLQTMPKEQYMNLRAKETKQIMQKNLSNFPKPILKDWKKVHKTNTPLISIKDTTIKYGTKTILENINWTVSAGENWAITGSNGAGKSTLISLIRRDCPQCYSNDIQLFGKKHGTNNSIWELRKKIGFISAESHTFQPADLICKDVVLSGLNGSIGLYDTPTEVKLKQADNWMKCMHIYKLADKEFGDISLVEKRLVLLARALIRDPLILIVDEICQSLTKNARDIILSVLDRLCSHEPPLSMICVSHHWDELPKSLNHSLHIKNSKIQYTKKF